MNQTTVSSFSHAAQQAQQWVNELAEELRWSEQHAYRLLKVRSAHVAGLAVAGGNG